MANSGGMAACVLPGTGGGLLEGWLRAVCDEHGKVMAFTFLLPGPQACASVWQMRGGVRAVWQANASPASESLRGLGRADTLTASSSGSCETCIKAHVGTHGPAFPRHWVRSAPTGRQRSDSVVARRAGTGSNLRVLHDTSHVSLSTLASESQNIGNPHKAGGAPAEVRLAVVAASASRSADCGTIQAEVPGHRGESRVARLISAWTCARAACSSRSGAAGCARGESRVVRQRFARCAQHVRQPRRRIPAQQWVHRGSGRGAS